MPFVLDRPLKVSSLDQFFSIGQATAAGSSQARFMTIRAGLYSQGDPLVLLSSSSTGIAWTVTGNTFSGTNIKRAVMPWTLNVPIGDYVLGLWTSSSSSGNALAITHSQILANAALAYTLGGDITASATAGSHELIKFYATGSVSTAALASTVSMSDLRGTGNVLFPLAHFRAATVV
jgi:hypothetical protein